MSGEAVAVVGSGIVGTTIAYRLAQAGHTVDIYEKGREGPDPALAFEENIVGRIGDPASEPPPDLKHLETSGAYRPNLDGERNFRVGGSAATWGGVTARLHPDDFATRSRFGFGLDWPFPYEALEPDYCDAEAMLGVSGSDEGNPFAAPRSRPYPLPAFELNYDARRLAERARDGGLILHTTAQARNRVPYDERAACANFGTCDYCPTGARYSPAHHLARAVGTGRCRLHTDVSVRIRARSRLAILLSRFGN